MECGVNMKVRSSRWVYPIANDPSQVDYILFMTADVTVTPNLNEIRDYKYVDKAELQAMFDDSGKFRNF
jgi:isopentenyldiphosphate isomerase